MNNLKYIYFLLLFISVSAFADMKGLDPETVRFKQEWCRNHNGHYSCIYNDSQECINIICYGWNGVELH